MYIQQIDNFPRKQQSDYTHIRKEKNKIRLLSIARISPEKNLSFALDILKDIDTKYLVEFHIYGTISDLIYWQKCQLIIKQFSSRNCSVVYKGAIHSDKIPKIISDYHAMFLPTTGENFGHSIFETFMAGRPVLISDQTPWRNLAEKKIGFDCDLNNKLLFNESLHDLIEMDQAEFDIYCEASFQFSNNYFNLNEMKKQYLKFFSLT